MSAASKFEQEGSRRVAGNYQYQVEQNSVEEQIMWKNPDELQNADPNLPEKDVLTCANRWSKMSTPRLHQISTEEVLLEADGIKHFSLSIPQKEDNGSFIFKPPLTRLPLYHTAKNLLILDLNGLLVDIVSPPPKGWKPDINIARRAIFERPFYLDFLKFCFERFEVGILSSRNSIAQKEDHGLFIFKPPLTRLPRYHPTKKLLILDINGLLVDIVSPPPKGSKPDINIARRAIFKRPFYLDFLKFCFERFEVGIWSSRNRKNVVRVVDYLLGDLKSELLFCWDLSHCTSSGSNTLENKHKRLVFKELKKLWEKQDGNLPWECGEYNESNTVLLDDSPYKALLNPPHTAVFPESYKFVDEEDTLLGPGGDLRVYLEGLAEAENVQKFVGQNPFGQGPITQGSDCWEFYHTVLDKFHSFPSTN